MTDSSFKTIFLHSYRRIWVGKGIFILEIIIQSAAAIIIGLALFGWLGNVSVYGLAGYLLAAVLTPLIIGMSILRAHVTFGIGDDALRHVPLKPHQILLPRMAAVLATWLQIVGPFFLVFLVTFMLGKIDFFMPGGARLLLLAQLIFFSDNFYSDFLRDTSHDLPIYAIYIFGICQWISCVSLPITWGFWMGSKSGHPSGLFLFQYYCYLIGPLILAVLIWTGLIRLFVGWTDPFWGIIFFTSALGILLSGYFFYKACNSWGRGVR